MGICGALSILFMSSRSGIIFNPSVDAIADRSQPTRDEQPNFKFQRMWRTSAAERRY